MGTLLLQQYSSPFFVLLILMLIVRRSYCQDVDSFEVCSRNFDCGNLKGLSYPFWSENIDRSLLCGQEEFKLKCYRDWTPSFIIEAVEFFITNIYLSKNMMTIARIDSTNGDVCSLTITTRLNETLLEYPDGLQNINFYYGCNRVPETIPAPNRLCSNESFYSNDTGSLGRDLRCLRTIQVPIPTFQVEDVMINGLDQLQKVVGEGFNVIYKYNNLCFQCNISGGICGTNLATGDFACHCSSDHSSPYTCFGKHGGSKWKRKVNIPMVIIASLAGGVGIIIASIICYVRRRNNSDVSLISFFQNEKVNNQNIEAFMRNYGSLIPTRYRYADVKKVTSSFKEKLGQGGFGSVYRGKLLDGRLVAVKMLNDTKGNGEEFINEVASISRTSHINIVSLLGFCLERHKRALIYEFMPNGSLEKFIGDENHLNTKQRLEWEKLYQIAIGVAKGLEYLHRGCNTRIIHFDIKPHNILLDKDFFPKISDFGLAKLCTREKSILSMLEARGTIGYIAPEVFSRNFGGVSHKSDVYSYGMVLLEMVGEKRRDDNVASEASENYFPYRVYKHLELNNFGYLGVMAAKDVEIVRKMSIVGLWCIQTNPSDRPSMNKVIEMLEGKIEILEDPPKPFLFSPMRSDSCTLSLS